MADWREIIRENVNMRRFNTFRLESVVKYYAKPENVESLIETLKFAHENNLNLFILGNGSNIIFAEDFYDNLLVIDMKGFSKIELENNELISQAGVKTNNLINFCIVNGISNFEFLAGIPGTVGGMIKMNAGAFGREISDFLIDIEVLDMVNYNILKIKKDDLKFEYRHTSNLDGKIILKARFNFKRDDPERIKKRVKEYLNKRLKNQPKGASAGSIFKNPENNFAGKLIEDAGLKGCKINDAVISKKHANFIINEGNAKGKDVLNLIKLIKEKVKRKFNIQLQEEVEIVKK